MGVYLVECVDATLLRVGFVSHEYPIEPIGSEPPQQP
jgi:hypothetical protein